MLNASLSSVFKIAGASTGHKGAGSYRTQAAVHVIGYHGEHCVSSLVCGTIAGSA